MRWTLLQPCRAISIHAAREGGDHHIVPLMADFNISIHAAREGGDFFYFTPLCVVYNFNPRRP